MKIHGKYTLYSFLPLTYEFVAGGDRNAKFTFNDEADEIRMFAVNSPSVATNGVMFHGQNDTVIKRARVVPSGGSKLLASPGTIAGQMFLNAYTEVEGARVVLDYVSLKFIQWGEWSKINAVLSPYKNIQAAPTVPSMCKAFISLDSGEFTADDFNVQDVFVGQSVQAMLEMEVETAGMWDADTRSLF